MRVFVHGEGREKDKTVELGPCDNTTKKANVGN